MTPIMKRTENKENAVSPVVGVMLMLVVTIVIAAVVAVFASGVITSKEVAPTAVMNVSIETTHSASHGGYSYTYPLMSIEYLTGTSELKTSEMAITTSWVGSDGKIHSNTYTGIGPDQMWNADAATTRSRDAINNIPAMYYNSSVMLISGTTVNDAIGFGKYVLKPGDTIVSNGLNVAYFDGNGSSNVTVAGDKSWKAIFGENYETITSGTKMSVTITSDGYVIYDKEVTVL